MAQKKILITGGSGFIGACLARRLLAEGHEVVLFLRKESKLWRLNGLLDRFAIQHIDMLDRDAVRRAFREMRPDTVYHLATYGAYSSQKDISLSVDTNIRCTFNIVDACQDTVSRLIYASSSSEYGIKDHPMRENEVLEPNSVYGITKAAATQYCMHVFKESGLPITVFRIFAAYGQYEEPTRLIPSIIVPYLRDESPRLSTPTSVRDFIFVDDVVDAFEKAADTSAAKGEILNLGTGIQHNISDVVSIAKEIAESEKEVIWGSVDMIRFEPEVWVADMSKTKKILQWAPRYGLREGLGKGIGWYRENMHLYSRSLSTTDQ